MALNNSIIGKQLLELGTVYIASNKPENVFLIILKTDDKNLNISVLYDRRHNVLSVSKDYRNLRFDENDERLHEDREIELSSEERQQVIDFIESYEE